MDIRIIISRKSSAGRYMIPHTQIIDHECFLFLEPREEVALWLPWCITSSTNEPSLGAFLFLLTCHPQREQRGAGSTAERGKLHYQTILQLHSQWRRPDWRRWSNTVTSPCRLFSAHFTSLHFTSLHFILILQFSFLFLQRVERSHPSSVAGRCLQQPVPTYAASISTRVF